MTNIFKHELFGSSELRAMQCFSVVRNPFVRPLSAFLQKFCGQRHGEVSETFLTRFGIDVAKGRISTYAATAGRQGESSLARQINGRIESLRNAHRGRLDREIILMVSTPTIFEEKMEKQATRERQNERRKMQAKERREVGSNGSKEKEIGAKEKRERDGEKRSTASVVATCACIPPPFRSRNVWWARLGSNQ